MPTLSLDPAKTALVLIDLQQGIMGRLLEPHPTATVLRNSLRLATRFRALGAPVILVRVSFHPDFKDFLALPADVVSPFNVKALPPTWADLVPEIGSAPGDIVITKRQWGAFYGTDLDLQLRRRGVDTIVLGGVSTNAGVESTARSAYDHGYAQVFAEDATASNSGEAHAFTMKTTFARIGCVRSTDEILAALPA